MSSFPRLCSIQARFTIAATALSMIVFVAAGVILDVAVRTTIQSDMYAETQRAGTAWIAAMRSGGTAPKAPISRVTLFQVVDSHGRVVHSSEPLAGMPPISTVRPLAGERIQHRTECLRGGECVMLSAIRVSPQEAGWLWAGEPHTVYAGMVQPIILATDRLEIYTATGGLLAVAVLAVMSWWVAGRTLRPVAAIRAKMSEITVSDLSLRVPEPSGRDEVAQLARTANETLARLEGAVEQQRQFASTTSHELRTPISGLRARLEEALLYRNHVDPHETIEAALSITDRLEAIISDLLLTARLRSGDPVPPEVIDLGALVMREAAARVTGVPVRVDAGPDVTVRGCRIQLIRILDNLLTNAQRHASGAVEVTVEARDGQAVVAVVDDGCGIAPEDRERVFERFTRLADGHRRDPGGSGLGLAISRDIAHAHRGTLRIEDSARGACFVLRLPLAEAGAPQRSRKDRSR
ncbi:HAMP domain-containing histidine kinase [Planotetraspora sp. A-T 1434]|uniref:sensor histidine kinase n=1 Tax=Planotetraspora sp. A-T 1434 TaxID=2979219 RepID=UPI0021C205C4|nr:HAMP domain-containing sensor histidine kinase [Planotetraspora sp. A-T 1434]MCT9932137.1 HAMP domain-containing histidine kinase [Planotetraspora sp. A-T 1434]